MLVTHEKNCRFFFLYIEELLFLALVIKYLWFMTQNADISFLYIEEIFFTLFVIRDTNYRCLILVVYLWNLIFFVLSQILIIHDTNCKYINSKHSACFSNPLLLSSSSLSNSPDTLLTGRSWAVIAVIRHVPPGRGGHHTSVAV